MIRRILRQECTVLNKEFKQHYTKNIHSITQTMYTALHKELHRITLRMYRVLHKECTQHYTKYVHRITQRMYTALHIK